MAYRILSPGEMADCHLAMLYDLGVESFLQEADFIEAFVPRDNDLLQGAVVGYLNRQGLGYSTTIHEDTDWNAEWEAHFEAVHIGDSITIRAPFHHRKEGTAVDLVLSPRMAFGTGHHETTYMLLEWMAEMDWKGKEVLDFGCGTGILGIYALLCGAESCCFVDCDPVCIENAVENLNLNELGKQLCILGSSPELPTASRYDRILANITRNALSEHLPALQRALKPQGMMALSGLLEADLESILKQAASLGFSVQAIKRRGEWRAVILGTQSLR